MKTIDGKKVVWETDNFIVVAANHPFISREEGGYMMIRGNGNFSKPYYHEHIFGRTIDAKKQKFPDAPYLPDRKSGFYDGFEPLNDDDIEYIIKEMKKLENSKKYTNSIWKCTNI